MFTGLIEDVGTLRQLRKGNDAVRITVATGIPTADLVLGESIAVNGICLTVVGFGDGAFSADVSPETLDRTNLGELKSGGRVNLERALRLSDRLGGHLVSGHVDGVATIVERSPEKNAVRFSFRQAAEVNRFVAEKGSIAVDGISLTVNAVSEETFTVALIPHSLAMTTLKDKGVGDRVNIETDILAKYLDRLLKAPTDRGPERSPLDLEFLAKHGFL